MKKTIFFMLVFGILVCTGLHNYAVEAANDTQILAELKEDSSNIVFDDKTNSSPEPEGIQDAKKVNGKNVESNTQDITNAITKQADFVFTYIPNQIYKVYCQAERLTDIQLQPGEEVLFVGAGDTARWMIDTEVSGSGYSRQTHIYIKPLKSGISTNFIINTDRHTYHLEVYATSWYTPIINWTYPQEEKAALLKLREQQMMKDKEIIPLGEGNLSPASLNFNYKITGRHYKWEPEMVFDDGLKTYIKMPQSMATDEAPALFIKDGKNLYLVNYRVKNNFYIVDRLFDVAELRVGKKSIEIRKTK